MESMEVDALPTRIYDFLYRLGLSANMFGFQYLSGAIFLSIRNPERFKISAKEIYLEISRLYRVEPKEARRAVRRALYRIWKNNPALGGETRSNPLSTEQFLSYACKCLAPEWENAGDATPETHGKTVSDATPETHGKTAPDATPETHGETVSDATPETHGETVSDATPETHGETVSDATHETHGETVSDATQDKNKSAGNETSTA